MATLYFQDTRSPGPADYAWDTAGNWWHSCDNLGVVSNPNGAIPLVNDNIYIVGQMDHGPSVPISLIAINVGAIRYGGAYVPVGGTFQVDCTRASTDEIMFRGWSSNKGSIYHSSFYDYAGNQPTGIIYGWGYFNQGSFNEGEIIGDGGYFANDSMNGTLAHINGSGSFDKNTANQGLIYFFSVFYENTFNDATGSIGSGEFFDTSFNAGICLKRIVGGIPFSSGDAIFYSTSYNHTTGDVQGTASYYNDTINYSNTYPSVRHAEFYDSSINEYGSSISDALFYNNSNNNGQVGSSQFWNNSFNANYGVLITTSEFHDSAYNQTLNSGGTEVVYFYDYSFNNGRAGTCYFENYSVNHGYGLYVYFDDYSYNYSYGAAATGVFRSGDTYNSGEVDTGYFHLSSQNFGYLWNYAEFYDTSENHGPYVYGLTTTCYFYNASKNFAHEYAGYFYSTSENQGSVDHAEFHDSSYNTVDVGYDVSFFDTSHNAVGGWIGSRGWGTVNFYGSSVNYGYVQYEAYFENTSINDTTGLVVTGHFDTTSYNLGTVTTGTFNNSSSNRLGGHVSTGDFHNTTYNAGITDSGSFYDTAYNSHQVGSGYFHNSSKNTGSVETGEFHDSAYNDTTGTCSPNDALFYDTSQNRGIADSADFYDSSQMTAPGSCSTANFWASSKNYGSGNSCSFHDTSENHGTIPTLAGFYDSSLNKHLIPTGVFHHNSTNHTSGTVTAATFYDFSGNNGAVNNSVFNNDSYNGLTGNVSGTATMRDSSYSMNTSGMTTKVWRDTGNVIVPELHQVAPGVHYGTGLAQVGTAKNGIRGTGVLGFL